MADSKIEHPHETIKIGDQATIYGDVFTGGKHIYQIHRPPLGRPFQAPPLPVHFIPLPEVTEVLKARLLADSPTTPGILVVSAIHGLGGIGKSTLASALAYDPEVQARFNDGILWATLGQQPDLLSLLSGWIQTLGDYDFRPTTIEAASTHLRTLLQDKATLLVVDDVWEPEHALPFRVGGPQGQVLITTRRADVAEEVGAELHQMDVMTSEQSLALLSARLNRPLAEMEQAEALALAKDVGYLPLALELAAARIARGVTWTVLHEALKAEIAHLEELEGPHRRRGEPPRLEASFNLSLNALRAEDEVAWQAFVWLGVLPEDVRIFAPMAATLWEMDETGAAEMLELLWNDALLLPASPLLIGKYQWPTYRLHDLLHDIGRHLLTVAPSQGLGYDLPTAHTTVLERYLQRAQNGLWHTLPDDGYIHAHLTWHMEKTGQAERIHSLLRKETDEGRNGWYEARERLGQTAGFMEDISRAWKLSEKQFAIHNSHLAIGLQCRYALIVASLGSLAGNLSSELLVTLVKQKIWTPAQGVTYARQVPDPIQRTEALARLVPYLPELFLDEMLVAISREDLYLQVKFLEKVASYLPEMLLKKGLELVQTFREEWPSGFLKLQVALASYLPESLRSETILEALAALQVIPQLGERSAAASALVPLLLDSGRIQEALIVTQAIEDTYEQADALTQLVPHLPEGLKGDILQEALTAVRGIENAADRPIFLVELVRHLPEGTTKDEVLRETLTASQKIEYTEGRAEILARLTPHLSEGLKDETLQEALAIVRAIEWEGRRVGALVQLALHLSEKLKDEILQEALAVARAIENPNERARALVHLVPHLAQELKNEVLQEALAVAHAIKDPVERVRVLTRLIPHLTKELKDEALREALAIVQAIKYIKGRVEAVDRLIPQLGQELKNEVLQEVLATVRAIKDTEEQADILTRLIAHLPGDLKDEALQEALAATRTIEIDEHRVEVLAELIPHLPKELKGEVLQEASAAAWAVEDIDERARVLTRLAMPLAKELKSKILKEVLTATQTIEDTDESARMLVWLIPYLPEKLKEEILQEALAAVWTIEDTDERARLLTRLIPYLPKELKEETLQGALAFAQTIKYAKGRVEALVELIPHLPEGLRDESLQKALATVQTIETEEDRADAFAQLVPHLPESLRDTILQETLTTILLFFDNHRGEQLDTVSTWILAQALQRLSPYLRGESLIVALRVAYEIDDFSNRAYALAGLTPYLIEFSPDVLFPLWCDTLHLVTRTRQELLANLCALVPVIDTLGGEKAVIETFRAIQDVVRWWP